MTMITPEAAWNLLVSACSPRPEVAVARRAGRGRVLARTLAANADFPAMDVSAMDGYALRGAPSLGAETPVAGTIAAGDPPGFALPAGEAARIMTGAPVPDAADRVLPLELSDGGAEQVVFHAEQPAGANIRRRGEVVRQGEILLAAGTLLTPAALALLASDGHPTVPVHGAPRVAILTTGDEVVAPELTPGPGQLRDSHTDFLLAATRTLGLEAESLGIAADRLDVLREKIARGLEADVLLICGGVSKGEFDLVDPVLAQLGCETLFDAVAIQPGKPLVAARHARGIVFGLPGNPASAIVCFWLFVRPALRRLMGLPDGFWRGALTGELAGALPRAKDRDRFLPAEISVEAGRLRVNPIQAKGSHDLIAYARGNALARVRAGSPAAAVGERCEVLTL